MSERPAFAARLIALASVLACLSWSAAAQTLERVQRVLDGDTVQLSTGEIIRISGIDAPELHCRCPNECTMARAARDFVIARTAEGAIIARSRSRDRYGRTIARVHAPDNLDLGMEMIELGLARRYNGRVQRQSWC